MIRIDIGGIGGIGAIRAIGGSDIGIVNSVTIVCDWLYGGTGRFGTDCLESTGSMDLVSGRDDCVRIAEAVDGLMNRTAGLVEAVGGDDLTKDEIVGSETAGQFLNGSLVSLDLGVDGEEIGLCLGDLAEQAVAFMGERIDVLGDPFEGSHEELGKFLWHK